MLHYDRLLKKLMLVRQVSQKRAIFVTIAVFEIKGLSFR